MQTLVLPGYSSSDKEWVDETVQKLSQASGFDTIRPFYWMHWTDENSRFNEQEKAELIVKHIKGENVYIVGKNEGLDIAERIKKLVPEQVTSISS